MKKYYFAYGSNLNLDQMAHRCPTAKVVGAGILNGYKLVFNRVASIEPDTSQSVPVGIWEIDEYCEASLDLYEGYPRLYRKEKVSVRFDGQKIEGMIYIMNSTGKQPPNNTYFQTIQIGYRNIGLDEKYLSAAYIDSFKPDSD